MFKFNDKVLLQERKNDVLTFGEMLIDMISEDYGDDFNCNTFNRFFGGSPANIAMNTKKLGINPIIVSSVGKDGLGKFLVSNLERLNIDTSCINRADDYSTSMVLITKSTGTPVPIFYRQADYHLNYSLKIENTIKESKIFHFSCWPISMEPSRSTLEKAISVCQANNVLISFDPNYHPMLWEKGKDGVEYVKSIIKYTDIIKPSEDDAERIFGKDTPENQMDKFLKLGAKLVIMTLGKDGAIVSNGTEKIEFSTLAKEVVDTTGAGDAFWSGFYSAVVKGYKLIDALKLGFAVCAFKLKYTGAVVDLPKLEEISRLYEI
ncbi:carbohydrate kinase family protein [Clostridium oryzae]|uniref:2-dehydro-3-deoxygluconokinase n=1 Tax=Clostridium oryzae TaxID=1450648 RepID=A0A1V4ISU2_9CLOT|nr:carbohydrate kinase [Clostridium oryzae]OPJ62537.1 2-dehydro-3-deoxygluconokinase [Clostridium oryzae]